MHALVVGGGVIGLFTSYYLMREGVRVTLIERSEPGKASAHAAGLIETFRFDVMNTTEMIMRMISYMRRGITAVRTIDLGWIIRLLVNLNKDPPQEAWDVMKSMAEFSISEYRRFAEENNDFDYSEDGFMELYGRERDLEEGIRRAKSNPFNPKFEVVDYEGFAGGIFFPGMPHISTELFVDRILREVNGLEIIRGEAQFIDESGVKVGNRRVRGDVTIITAGIWTRRLGIPVAPFKGYGVRVRSRDTVKVPMMLMDHGIILVQFSRWLKVTGGFDLDNSTSSGRLSTILERARSMVSIDEIIDWSMGYRPCTIDGFPVISRRDNIVVATGNCRLGWSYGPAMGKYAADMALGRIKEYPYLSRYRPNMHT